ncbi:hypothetical protein YPPY113_3120, partial [Yersinia pestis PY-113]
MFNHRPLAIIGWE